MCTDPTLQERAKSFSLWKTAATPEREKVRQRGSGAESREPRVCQRAESREYAREWQ